MVPDNPSLLALPAGARASGRFEAPEERSFSLRKFEELRRYTQRTMLVLPPLIVGLWAWDWVIDPRAAPGTLGLRLGMASCLVPCILALRSRRVGLLGFTLLLYACVLATEVFWLAILQRLDGGLVYGIGAYLFYVLGVLVISLPLRLRDNVLGLTIVLMVPNLVAAAGFLPGFQYARYNTLIVPAAGLSVFTLWAFDRLYRRVFTYQRSIERLAGEDPLTGIANRRHFMSAAAQVFERLARYQRPASLILLDLDHFKAVNDRHGHAAGDVVLRATAQLLNEHRRGSDVPARLGGEEFAMLLPETELDGAVALAERLRQELEDLHIATPSSAPAELRVTTSIGVAACHGSDASIQGVMDRADGALYRAKEGGRNRVEQEAG